jgi:flavin-dependent dehydrogenase
MYEYDIAILGGGLAGSSLAATLSRKGWNVVVLERRNLPKHKVCGEFLSPETQGILQRTELYDTVAGLQPATMEHALLTAPAGVSLRLALPGTAWGVSRFALDAALLEAAAQAGAVVQTGVTALDIAAQKQGCAVSIRRGQAPETLQARAVIVACGRHPPAALRTPSEMESFKQHPKHIGIKCHYRGIRLSPQVELYLFPGGYVGLSPVEQGHNNLCLLATYQALTAAGGSVSSLLTAIRHWNPALNRRLEGGEIVPGSQVTVAAVDTARPALPWDNVARVGDAVTMIPPLCGDGMAMALRSAEICAPLAHDYLRGSSTLAEWSQRYSQQWHQEFDHILLVGRALQVCLMRPGLAESTLLLGNLLPMFAQQAVRLTRGKLRPNSIDSMTINTV